MEFEIGTASAADGERMAQWAAAEGWNHGLTDVEAFRVADPPGFLVGRLDGEPVTSISVVRYGETFGFLGMYIARPLAGEEEHRSVSGVGSADALEVVIDHDDVADERGAVNVIGHRGSSRTGRSRRRVLCGGR